MMNTGNMPDEEKIQALIKALEAVGYDVITINAGRFDVLLLEIIAKED